MGLKELGPKPFAAAGMLAVVLMVIAVVICVLGDPSWDFYHQSLCDFGASSVKFVSVSFIFGCIVSGLLFIAAGIGWALFEKSKFVRIGGAIVCLAGAALMCVGIFDVSFDFHYWVSIIFAVIFIVAIAFVCLQDIIDRHLILVAGFGVMAIYGIITLFVPSIPYALTQIILMGYVFIWFFLKSMKPFEPKSELLRKIIGM